MDEVGINQALLQKIVYSIGRAVEHDLPEYLQEHRNDNVFQSAIDLLIEEGVLSPEGIRSGSN